MKRICTTLLTMLLGFGSLTLAGCESQGPFEEAGEEIDEGIDEVEQEVDDVRD